MSEIKFDWKKAAEKEYEKFCEQRKKGISKCRHLRVIHFEKGNNSTFKGLLEHSGWNRDFQYNSKYNDYETVEIVDDDTMIVQDYYPYSASGELSKHFGQRRILR